MMCIKNIGILIVSILFCFHGATAQSQTGESNVSERIVPILFYLLDESAGSINPVVSFDTPAEGQVFTQGDSVAVTASASDSDGTIAKVDLYLNDVIVNSDVQAPYQWSGGVLDTLAPGEHVLRLVAVDNLGNETAVERMIEVASDWISCATEGGVCSVPGLATVRYGANGQYNILTDIEVSVQCTNAVFGDPIPGVRKSCEYQLQELNENQAPVVSFLLPTQTVFEQGQSIIVEASAADADGNVAGVQLFLDDVLVRQEVSPPYTWNDTSRGAADAVLDSLSVGQHTLRLVATDNEGLQTAVERTITVESVVNNQPPTVNFTTPNNNQTFTENSPVNVAVNASDDSAVVRVDLYVDGAFDSSDNSAPYSWSLSSLALGSHTLRAIATDDQGLESESTISITIDESVNPPADGLSKGRAVKNVLARRTLGVTPDEQNHNNFASWSVVSETNASINVAGDGRSVTFSRNVFNNGANARAYIEFTIGEVWSDDDLSVCFQVQGYAEDVSGNRAGALEVVSNDLSGTKTRTVTQDGIYCTVLTVDSTIDSAVVRLGLGVTGNDTRTNELTISRFSVSPTADGLPNEFVLIDQRGQTPSQAGISGAAFNYDKQVNYDPNSGLTSFTVPASVNTGPSASHVLAITDSFGGFFFAGVWYPFYGLDSTNTTPNYVMTMNNQAGRSLEDTNPDNDSLLDTMLAEAIAKNANDGAPGICWLAQGVNDFVVETNTAVETLTNLQAHIDWCQDNGMFPVVVTASPFGNAVQWTPARETQRSSYNTEVRNLVANSAGQIALVDYDALLDTDNNGTLDDNLSLNDGLHPNAAGMAVLSEEADNVFNQIIDSISDNNGDIVNAVINPSRTDCASPCTVVFSAEKTTAQGLDDHGIWSQLSYYWDFDTDESDTYGELYEQTYTYVDGDTAYESGHVPLVTKTFLCDSGTCTYNVGMRAQNVAGDYDDAFQTITVRAESTQWSAANTICVSNTLSLAADWTSFDKACPAGATKQATIPLPDQFDGKLVLLRRGDVFDSDDLLDEGPNNLDLFAIQSGQSNYKVSNFGNNADSFPDIQGRVLTGVASYNSSGTTITSVDTTITDADVSANGWTNNGYFEGLRLASFIFPESFNHIGIHDIDVDQEDNALGGVVSFSGGVRCTDHPTFLDCANVPFPKGGYISKTNIVGSDGALTNQGVTLNIGTTGCVMVNFTGMVDTQVRRVGEHNLRIAGWYRFNIMRSAFLGGHHTVNKAKITPRICVDSALFSSQWTTRNDLPAGWQDDIEGRTRADIYTGTDDDYLHVSRYLTIAHNQIGSSNQAHWGTHPGGGKVGSGVNQEADGIFAQDAMISHNKFESEIDGTTILTRPDANGGGPIPQDITRMGWYKTCVDNDYFDGTNRCYPSSPFPSWNVRREPTPITPPLKPGS